MRGSLEILEGGMLTTVQDTGRHGYLKYGVPRSGAMDDHGFKMANWLVGNPEHSPVLECTLKGPIMRFESKAFIGIAGAETDLHINGISADRHRSHAVSAGDMVRIGHINKGCRVYVSIRGTWKLDKIMGSWSTCLPAGFGGFEGRPLKKGDILHWNERSSDGEVRKIPQELLPHFANRQQIRIIEGPEWDWLSEDQKHQLLVSEFEVSPQSNRMGIRLNAKKALNIKEKSMRSAPVTLGTVQMPPSGQPILLMNDAQSVGGYPRVAKVIDADLWRLGQIWSPVKVKFNLISFKKALDLSAYKKELYY